MIYPAITSITITTSGLLYATPVTFTIEGGAASATLSFLTQTANTALLGPTSGGAAAPTFRALVAADIPDISATYSAKAGSTSFVTAGTIATGTWNGTRIGVVYGGTNADMSATGGTGTFVRQATAGAAFTSSAIVVSDIPSGAYTNTQAGGASTPAQTWSGAPYTAGTATTNFPLVFAQTTGATAATSWSTSGTYIGINAGSGFVGNFIDLHTNGGASLFKVSYLGSITFAGSFNMSSSGIVNSYIGTASQAIFAATGTLYTAGTGTTNFPQWFSQSGSATAVTTWNTGGTYFGANANSGFTGNFLDFHLNGGASLFNVSNAGKVTAASAALTNGPTWSSGSGSPETAVTAPIGSLYSRTDGGASTSLYVKESGAGNTGWVAK